MVECLLSLYTPKRVSSLKQLSIYSCCPSITNTSEKLHFLFLDINSGLMLAFTSASSSMIIRYFLSTLTTLSYNWVSAI